MFIEMKKYTFTKEERLCSKRFIENLFHKGSSFVVYPFRLVYLKNDDIADNNPFPVKAIISVSKKRFKRAVDRNLIKRQMRECYRLEKHHLYNNLQQYSVKLLVAIQFVGKQQMSFEELHTKLQQLLKRLENELDKSNLGKGN